MKNNIPATRTKAANPNAQAPHQIATNNLPVHAPAAVGVNTIYGIDKMAIMKPLSSDRSAAGEKPGLSRIRRVVIRQP